MPYRDPERDREYHRKNVRRTGRGPVARGVAGEIAERVVALWLEERGWLLGFGPPQGPHDILSTLGTVQVKVGDLNTKTGTVRLRTNGKQKHTTSDFLALIHPVNLQDIRWKPGVKNLPQEILNEMRKLRDAGGGITDRGPKRRGRPFCGEYLQTRSENNRLDVQRGMRGAGSRDIEVRARDSQMADDPQPISNDTQETK